MVNDTKTIRRVVKKHLIYLLGYIGTGYSSKIKVDYKVTPKTVYDKLTSYYIFESTLHATQNINGSKLSVVGTVFGTINIFGMLGFIELIGNTDRINDLYSSMVDEISSLPSGMSFDNYIVFRNTLLSKFSPTRNLSLIITSRYLDEWVKYNKIIGL